MIVDILFKKTEKHGPFPIGVFISFVIAIIIIAYN